MGDIFKAILGGIIQGLTEFLPVSSSGHLAIFNNLFNFGFDDAILFTLILHLGTLTAVVIAYFSDIKALIIGFLQLIVRIFTGKFKYSRLSTGERFAILVFIASVPLVVGALIDKQIEFLTERTKIIGVFLIVNAVILFLSDRIKTDRKDRTDRTDRTDKTVKARKITEKNATPIQALLVGLWQLIGVPPGLSRSGMTITGGLVNGFSRTFAVKFSFIMSIPAILGASVFKFADVAKNGAEITGTMIASCIVGFIFAFIFGLFAIILLRMIVKSKKFYIFSIYCFIVGLIAIIFG